MHNNHYNNASQTFHTPLPNSLPLIYIVTLLPHAQFQKIDQLESVTTGAVVDVLGVVESVQPASTITRRDGSEVRPQYPLAIM